MLALILLFFDASLNFTIDPLLSTIVENFVSGYLLTNSMKLYKDIEKNINNTLSLFLNHRYNDNPTKQF